MMNGVLSMLRNPTDLDMLTDLTFVELTSDGDIVGAKEQEVKDHIKTLLTSVEPLIHELNTNISQCDDEPFRVVEIGCGASPLMCIVVQALAKYYNKQFSFVGIDIDKESISILQQKTRNTPSVRYIAADASNLDWFTLLDRKTFNTAIFINPIVENPMEAALEAPFNTRESVESNPRFQELYIQYQQFQKIFTETLPACLKPNGSILVRTFYREEYLALLPLLSAVATGLPSTNEAVPDNHCLITRMKPLQSKLCNTFNPTIFSETNKATAPVDTRVRELIPAGLKVAGLRHS